MKRGRTQRYVRLWAGSWLLFAPACLLVYEVPIGEMRSLSASSSTNGWTSEPTIEGTDASTGASTESTTESSTGAGTTSEGTTGTDTDTGVDPCMPKPHGCDVRKPDGSCDHDACPNGCSKHSEDDDDCPAKGDSTDTDHND